DTMRRWSVAGKLILAPESSYYGRGPRTVEPHIAIARFMLLPGSALDRYRVFALTQLAEIPE
ncbi:MAG: hypothetical protein LC130_16110, partial [Bryobacterales bacterium]|nr:hypothetical protein [Bryobacterales bacterium]